MFLYDYCVSVCSSNLLICRTNSTLSPRHNIIIDAKMFVVVDVV